MHTLMKGLATRLEALVKQTRAPVIILMEGDCWPVRSFPQIMEIIEDDIVKEKFVWLGFFLNGRPNKDESEHAKRTRLTRRVAGWWSTRSSSSVTVSCEARSGD